MPSLSLIIEIDGASHNYKEEYDHKREDLFKTLNLNLFKVSDNAVKTNLSWVLNCLKDFIISEYGYFF